MKRPVIEILYAAINAEIGVAVSTTDPERLRQALYRAKKEDDDFKSISICLSRTSPETELWVFKK